MYLDAHCHLEEETYGAELDDVIERAQGAGMTHFVAVGASRGVGGAHEAVALAERRANIYATVGIHPHEASMADAAALAAIEALVPHPKVVAVGEVGLDYHYNYSPPDVQRQVFHAFLTMAQRHNKPVMLHVREAHADCLAALDAVGLPARGGVVHCFTGGPEEARAYLDRGLYLSIPGVITFKTAEPLREAVRQAPLDRLFLETDCPYLAPVPHRGKRNEPAFLVETAKAVGLLTGHGAAEIGAKTRENALRFFGMAG